MKIFKLITGPLFLLFFISSQVLAQYDEAIKTQYKILQNLGESDPENLNLELIFQHTYPPLIELIGGKEKYIQVIKAAMEIGDDSEEEEYYEDEEEGSWTLQGSKIEIGEIGKTYQSGEELQVVLEIKEIDIFSNREEIYSNYELAISRDGGNFWYFLDSSINWEKVVPNLHPDIVKPEEKEEIRFNDN